MKYLLRKWALIMRNKLKYLVRFSLQKKLKTKWFLIANILLSIVIISLLNIDTIIKKFGGDFNSKTEILVIDNNNYYDEFKSVYDSYKAYLDINDKSVVTKYSSSLENAKKEVKEEDKVLLILNDDSINMLKVEMITKGNIDTTIYQLITTSLNTLKRDLSLKHYDIKEELINLIDSPVDIERTKLEEGKSNDEMMEMMMGTVFPALILPFFMLTMILIQMIGAEINEEKTTKGMEIIISNVSPKVHLFSKVLAGNIFVILQGILLVIYFLLGLGIRIITAGKIITPDISNYIGDVMNQLTISGVLNNLGNIIPLTLILMIGTFLAYSLVAGILASMTTNMEDFQQLQTPIIIISLIGYYLSIMAAYFEGSLFIRVLSYVPFLSALLSPALLLLGQITILDTLISLLFLIIFIYILFKYGLKIYKVGILNYSSNNLWKKMLNAVKSK